ncbi:MAG: SGNH/GDSL hydrolase family protein, partial [Clostridia bacterium]|nr:SGNH/GDSL hydrolase family protein [Clostridia bacterium]
PAATEAPTEAPTEPVTEAPTEEVTTEEITTEEETTLSIQDQLGLDVKDEDLKDVMQNIFTGTQSLKETVMFLDKGEVKSLLFPIKDIVSVTSYDGKTVYEEGKDYVIEDGKLKVTEDSAIKVITSDKYYNHPGSLITMNGKPMFWGESQVKAWQVSVTYNHDAAWEGYVQESQLEVYQNFVKKLIAGEDVTVFFYGDSITWGACSTFMEGVEPKQGAYAMLFTEALADLFGYTVKYVNTGLVASMAVAPVPTADYVAGDRGTITYVNTAIGGWTSNDGVTNFDKFVGEQVEKYGCDLFVLGYGMNDGGVPAATTKANAKKMIDKLLEIKPEASVMMVSTMTPHTGSNWDHAVIQQQEKQLLSLAKTYRKDGNAVAVACVHSVSVAIQEHKTFNDYSGNNINHPNDWFYRVYAQTLLQTLIGYENMN